MSGVAIEELLGLWSAELREAKGRLRPLFSQAGTAGSAALFLDGRLGPERRKTRSRRGGGRQRTLASAGGARPGPLECRRAP